MQLSVQSIVQGQLKELPSTKRFNVHAGVDEGSFHVTSLNLKNDPFGIW